MSEPITTAELAGRLGGDDLVLLDVRSAAEFAGHAVAPCDPRPGRIPGARHVALEEILGATAGGQQAVQELVGAEAGTEVVAYCHSGGRSAVAVQILTAVGYRAVATHKLAGGSGYLAVFSPPEGAGRKSPRDIVACGDRAGTR